MMDWNANDLMDMWRAFTIALGGVILGMSFLILRWYGPLAVKSRDVVPQHVALLAVGLSMVVGIQMFVQTQRLVEGAPPSFRIWANPIAYMPIILGLWLVLRDVRRRREAGLNRRQGDL